MKKVIDILQRYGYSFLEKGLYITAWSNTPTKFYYMACIDDFTVTIQKVTESEENNTEVIVCVEYGDLQEVISNQKLFTEKCEMTTPDRGLVFKVFGHIFSRRYEYALMFNNNDAAVRFFTNYQEIVDKLGLIISDDEQLDKCVEVKLRGDNSVEWVVINLKSQPKITIHQMSGAYIIE